MSQRAAQLIAAGLAVVVAAIAGCTPSTQPAPTPTVPVSTPTPPVVAKLPPTARPTEPPAAPTNAPPTNTPPPDPLCTVAVSGGLSLRPGPGTAYAPIATMPNGTLLVPRSFVAQGIPDGAWVEVAAGPAGQPGWVNFVPGAVDCNVDPTRLPVGLIPSTPTSAPTVVVLAPTSTPPAPTATRPAPTATPTVAVALGPTATPRPLVVPPVQGTVTVTLVDPESREATNQLIFQVEAFHSGFGSQDGAGILHVDMRILDSSGREVYQKTETMVKYCAFGEGAPRCNVFRFNANSRWPGTNIPVRPGQFVLRAIARAVDGQTTVLDETITLRIR